MALTDEQVTQVKEQLLKQLDNFPKEKQEQIKQQVESMSNEEVENFVKQNQLGHLPGGCVFCAIVEGKMNSYKIGENEENIAILELNPLSKGHTLIVPKKHEEKTPESANNLVEEIKSKLKEKYSPNEIQIQETKITDHSLLEVIPIYGDETEKTKASEEALKEIQGELVSLTKEPEKEIVKEEPKEPEEPEETHQAKSRIP
jgi:histidine triad (HIT) family protein